MQKLKLNIFLTKIKSKAIIAIVSGTIISLTTIGISVMTSAEPLEDKSMNVSDSNVLDDYVSSDSSVLLIAKSKDDAEKARKEAEEKARKEAEEKAKRDAENRQRNSYLQNQISAPSDTLVVSNGRFNLSLADISDQQYIDTINSWFANYPLAGFGQFILECGKANNLDPFFITAVITEESGRATSSLARNNNNLFGRKSTNGWAYYSSKEECISQFGPYINSMYINCGYNYLWKIQDRYCPNQGWAVKIASYMRSLTNMAN